MSRIRLPGFVGPTYLDAPTDVDAQDCINLYPEVVGSGAGKAPAILRGTPGLKVFTTLPQAPIRAVWAGEGRLFVIAGIGVNCTLYEVFTGGTYNTIGTMPFGYTSSSAPSYMAPNGNQLMVVSSGVLYIVAKFGTLPVAPFVISLSLTGICNTNGTAVTRVSGDNFHPWMAGLTVFINMVTYTVSSVAANLQSMVLTGSAGVQTGVTWATTSCPHDAIRGCFIDGYFAISRDPACGYGTRFNISNLYDGSVWSALDFGIKSAYPDNIAAIETDGRGDLAIWGTTNATEVWWNKGDTFPFARNKNVLIPEPCCATHSAIYVGGAMCWLGGNRYGKITAWVATGYSPQRVSTHAIERAWESYATVSDAISWSYTMAGHTFWIITFPTQGASWCYDLTTQIWHKRMHWTGSAWANHLGRCHAFVFGKHLIGARDSGILYELDPATYTEGPGLIPMRRQRVIPYLSDRNIKHFFHSLELDGEMYTQQAVTLDWSDDGGRTWSTAITLTPALVGGATSYAQFRSIWRRLGSGTRRLFRLTSDTTGEMVWNDAYIDVTQGTS